MKKCKCGNPIKDPRHDTCYSCFQKRRGGSAGGERLILKLPADYLNKGYFDDRGYLRAGIFKEEAKAVANVLASLKMTATSLRAFYNKLKAIENRYKSANNNFELVKPNLYAFERDVAYQVSRGVVSEAFREFINKNSALAIKGPKEFKGFVEHFLSVLAYFKDYSTK